MVKIGHVKGAGFGLAMGFCMAEFENSCRIVRREIRKERISIHEQMLSLEVDTHLLWIMNIMKNTCYT